MARLKSVRLTVAVGAAAALIVAAGGGAIASNMAFKINMPIVANGPGFVGDNDVSVPYFNPYTNNCLTGPSNPSCAGDFCKQVGLPGGLAQTSIEILDQTTGVFTTAGCPTATATTGPSFQVPLIAGKGIRIRSGTTAPPASIVIVGSHNPATTVFVPLKGANFIGNTFFSVPYHTTAVTHKDLCAQIGLRATLPAGSIIIVDPVGGTADSRSCSATTGVNLQLGRAVTLIQPNVAGQTSPITFVPAHF